MYSSKIDFIFPFVVFFYGILMVFVLENGHIRRVAQLRGPELYEQLSKHRFLGWCCFWLGGLWSLQNIL